MRGMMVRVMIVTLTRMMMRMMLTVEFLSDLRMETWFVT